MQHLSIAPQDGLNKLEGKVGSSSRIDNECGHITNNNELEIEMAAGKRKASESFKAYRARLNDEQRHIERMAQGRMIFQSTFTDPRGTLKLISHTARRNPDPRPCAPHYI